MKNKLLKKVRKECKIIMFNKGETILGLNIIADNDMYYVTTPFNPNYGYFYYTYNEAVDCVLEYVRKRYGKPNINNGLKVFGK